MQSQYGLHASELAYPLSRILVMCRIIASECGWGPSSKNLLQSELLTILFLPDSLHAHHVFTLDSHILFEDKHEN